MGSVSDIIAEMMEVAPPGQYELSITTVERLRTLTSLLLGADRWAAPEFERYTGVTRRELDLSMVSIDMCSAYSGKRILITGGTGCIGTTLLGQLQGRTDEVFVISRGIREYTPMPGVTYLQCDVADGDRLRELITEIRPEVVFHLAAQRSPWLAERAIAETVMTNVIGTRNVLRACRAAGVERFIHASTGKAMRYYTTDIYAASKKLAEWLVLEYANEGRLAGSCRFTHVVDNAVVLQKIEEAMSSDCGVVRLHDPETAFYVQSAIESAQLLLLAGLNPDPTRLRMIAIRDLGDPVSLLSMALGKISSKIDHPPIYFCGFEQGYEKGTPPGLYDPYTATDVSPLINAVEAPSAVGLDCVPAVDRFTLVLPADGSIEGIVDALDGQCRQDDPLLIAGGLADAGRAMADAMFGGCPEDLFARLSKIAVRAGGALPTSREVRVEAHA